MSTLIELIYILSAFLFAIGLKMLSSPTTARQGNILSSLGMLSAVIVTLFNQEIIDYKWILLGLCVGSLIGILVARWVAMTAIPEMVALLNGSGGGASLLLGWAEYHQQPVAPTFTMVTILLAVLIGGCTLSGSILAWAKLRNVGLGNFKIGRALVFKGQQPLNILIILVIIALGFIYCTESGDHYSIFLTIVCLAILAGVMVVIPIGGADMPVIISLLNSYSGLAACAAGFAIQNNILIVAGSLVGASGIILTNIMCKAMNRSLVNVLASGFGTTTTTTGTRRVEKVNPISAHDAFFILEAARSVVFVPGYGLAVAQAQHAVKELAEFLENNQCTVQYAIHPVAGRMPGHMNVLLAEADVPYEQLVEMEDINRFMPTVDVCLVIGANDVVNPAAREDDSSPIYGMPIINVDYAQTVIVMKRSMATGFAGIDNALFSKNNTRMLFGDAKNSLQALTSEFKGS